MNSLGAFHKKLCRYWVVGHADQEASYGWLAAYDSLGVFFLSGCGDGTGDIDGAEFYPWHQILTISYFASDLEDSDAK